MKIIFGETLIDLSLVGIIGEIRTAAHNGSPCFDVYLLASNVYHGFYKNHKEIAETEGCSLEDAYDRAVIDLKLSRDQLIKLWSESAKMPVIKI